MKPPLSTAIQLLLLTTVNLLYLPLSTEAAIPNAVPEAIPALSTGLRSNKPNKPYTEPYTELEGSRKKGEYNIDLGKYVESMRRKWSCDECRAKCGDSISGECWTCKKKCPEEEHDGNESPSKEQAVEPAQFIFVVENGVDLRDDSKSSSNNSDTQHDNGSFDEEGETANDGGREATEEGETANEGGREATEEGETANEGEEDQEGEAEEDQEGEAEEEAHIRKQKESIGTALARTPAFIVLASVVGLMGVGAGVGAIAFLGISAFSGASAGGRDRAMGGGRLEDLPWTDLLGRARLPH